MTSLRDSPWLAEEDFTEEEPEDTALVVSLRKNYDYGVLDLATSGGGLFGPRVSVIDLETKTLVCPRCLTA